MPASESSQNQIPDKPVLEGLEAKWDAAWAEQGTYLFDRLRAAQAGRDGVYSIDTPPPRHRAACTSDTCSRTRTPT